jgi:two-component system, NarL family, response regulator LiaR
VSVIRVVLADDHGVVRRGIRDFLTEAGDMTVVAEAENGAEAYDRVMLLKPDVVVLDVQMPEGSGIEVTRRLREAGSTAGILILTAFDDPPYIKAAIEAGANGYVMKSSDADTIIEAVRAVHEGKVTLNAPLSPSLLDVSPRAAPNILTEREQEILQLAARGLTNKAIGFQLSISDRTVQGHLANIYGKLEASSRTEAVTKAVAMGLIRVAPS